MIRVTLQKKITRFENALRGSPQQEYPVVGAGGRNSGAMEQGGIKTTGRKKTIGAGLKRFWRKISAQELLLNDDTSESAKDLTIHSPKIRKSSRTEDLTILAAEDVLVIRLDAGVELTVFGLSECNLTHRLDRAPCHHDVRLAFALTSGCRSRMPLLRDQNSYALYKLLLLFDRDPAHVLGGHFDKHAADERADRFAELLSRGNPSAACLQVAIEQRRRSRASSVTDLSTLATLQSLEELTIRPPSPASAPGSTWCTPRDGSGSLEMPEEGAFETKTRPFPKVLKGSSSWDVL
jgi:hypothetical protein